MNSRKAIGLLIVSGWIVCAADYHLFDTVRWTTEAWTWLNAYTVTFIVLSALAEGFGSAGEA